MNSSSFSSSSSLIVQVADLDLAKTRVVECLQLAGDMMDLSMCSEVCSIIVVQRIRFQKSVPILAQFSSIYLPFRYNQNTSVLTCSEGDHCKAMRLLKANSVLRGCAVPRIRLQKSVPILAQ